MKVDRSQQEAILKQYAEKAVAFDKKIEVAQVTFDGPDKNLLASVLIWHPNKVDMDLCEKVSNILNEMIDKDDPFNEQYTLEVASLSLTRKLKTVDDFRRAMGERISVKYQDKSKPDLSGQLTDWQNGMVTITGDKKTFQIPIDEIKHATICF